MTFLIFVFWFLLFIVFYTYLGYGMLLFIITRFLRFFRKKDDDYNDDYEPEVTLLISAYNEKAIVNAKMKNCKEIDYPLSKLHVIWVTDGSDDGTPEELMKYNGVEIHHLPSRMGKINAMNRGMKFVKTPLVIFTDANTMLGKDSVRRIVRLFSKPEVGCVSGEKRIMMKEKDTAAGSGEGIYWKYESKLKQWDSELHSVVGAAGELFAIRSGLYRRVEEDIILDDFVISLRVAMSGFLIKYDPEAYASEAPSASVSEELKRKIRISAGGIQSIVRLAPLLNIFRYGILSFQYISHRVLRWTLAPLSLLLLIPVSLILAISYGLFSPSFFTLFFWGQIFMYLAAFAGWYLENKKIRIKLLFVPYYFFIMNLSVFLGFKRYLTGKQTVIWERARREEVMVE